MKTKTVPAKAAPPLPKKGVIVTKALVTRRWGRYAASALQCLGHLYYLNDENQGAQSRYRVIQPFPSDVPSAIRDWYTKPINEALDEAFVEAEALKDELDEWYDNLPESFQNGDKGEQLQSAISELEDVQDFRDTESTALLATLPNVVVWPSGNSRADRCAGAARICEAVRVEIIAKVKSLEAADQANDAEPFEECDSNLDDMINTLQGIEFPGMY